MEIRQLPRHLGATMRSAAVVATLCLAAGSASADIVFYNSLSYNASGQVTAHYQAANNVFFDLFVDIQDASGNTVCHPGDPCFPNSPTSTTFGSGYFKMSFEVLMNGQPAMLNGAGLNQQQTQNNSFFDVYFDTGGQEAALGINVAPQVAPPDQTPLVTGPGAIGYPAFSNQQPGDPCKTASPGDPCQSTFFLDPMSFETFNITLEPSLTLPNMPAPPLTSNANAALPEPASLLLLGSVAAFVTWRWRKIQRLTSTS